MLFSLSWRNVWRNKVRSTVIIFSVAVGIFAGLYSTAFFKGMANQRIRKVIDSELSYLQIHKPGFRETSDFKIYMTGTEKLTEGIARIPQVTGVSNRIVAQAMIASAETATGVIVKGVDIKNETRVTNIQDKLIDGEYFKGIKRNPVVIGKKLAEKLNVKVRSKVVITLQDMDNNITSGAFRVAGIYTTNDNIFDEANVFVRFSDLKQLINFPDNAADEIAVNIMDNKYLPDVMTKVKALAGDYEVLDWKQLSPEMDYLIEAMDMYMYIFIIIILLALLFGIINTMLMVVMERTKELGMLMAIGMNRFRIFSMIVLESVMLSLTGGVVGVILGGLAAKYGETHPVDLSWWALGYEEIGYDAFVYTSIEPAMMVNVTLLVILTGIIAALYPAYKALKNDPADALRME